MNIVSVFCLSSALSLCFAQQEQIQEPEYVNVFWLLDSKTATLKPTDRQTGTISGKAKLMGFRGGSTVITIRGAKSSLRLASESKPDFIIRVEDRKIDPATIISLYKLTVAKGDRQISLMRVGSAMTGAKTTNTTNDAQVPFAAVKYGSSSFKVTPNQPLSSGEYALIIETGHPEMNSPVYCFGID